MLRPGDRQLIKEWNEGLVLETIRRWQPVTRLEVAERTGLGKSTISVITSRLRRRGLLEEIGSAETVDAGRRPVLLQLQARAYSVLGIKLSPRTVTAAALDLQAEPVLTRSVPLPGGASPLQVKAALTAAAEKVLADSPADLGPPVGVGLVMPGVVESETGCSINPYYPGWASAPFRLWLEEELGLPVLADNDANALALAEYLYGSGQGAESLLCLTVGIGIGAGVVIGGRLHRGFRSGAGEIGHVLADLQGERCLCGRRGCLETVAADPALERRSGRSREELVQAAAAGDNASRRLLAEAGEAIGQAIAGAVNLISPSRVVVGGEAIMQAGPLLLDPIRRAVAARAFPVLAEVPVQPALLGDDGWVRGAAALVLEEAFRVALHRRPDRPVTEPEWITLHGSVGGE